MPSPIRSNVRGSEESRSDGSSSYGSGSNGSRSKHVIVSEGESLKVRMVSNDVYDATGFLATYVFVRQKGVWVGA